jgi:hypothetical protein
MLYSNFKLRRKSIHWIQCRWISQFLKDSISAHCHRDLHKPRLMTHPSGPFVVSLHNIAVCFRSSPFNGSTMHATTLTNLSFVTSYSCTCGSRHRHQTARCHPRVRVHRAMRLRGCDHGFAPSIVLRSQASSIVGPWLCCVFVWYEVGMK